MYDCCVAASHLNLQLAVLVCHAYFTVPLRHQVSTVSLSLWHLLLTLLYLSWTACARSCAPCVDILHRGHRNHTIALTCQLVCAGGSAEKVQYVHVSVGLAQVAARHSVCGDVVLYTCRCVAIHVPSECKSCKLKSALWYACIAQGVLRRPAKTHIPSKKMKWCMMFSPMYRRCCIFTKWPQVHRLCDTISELVELHAFQHKLLNLNVFLFVQSFAPSHPVRHEVNSFSYGGVFVPTVFVFMSLSACVLGPLDTLSTQSF